MNWIVNSASIVGRDHQLSLKNKQDFSHFHQTRDFLVATVCDGCGESKFSEVGASLLSMFIVNFMRNTSSEYIVDAVKLKVLLEYEIELFVKRLEGILFFEITTQPERISFIKEFLLSTCLFCVILNDKVVLGSCGDGVIIKNKQIYEINQEGKPEYIAYKVIPKEALETRPSELEFFTIQVFDQNEIDSIIIGSDGIQAIIDNGFDAQLYETQKRQLQRKFNVWQENKLFIDDATCIVIEKQNGN